MSLRDCAEEVAKMHLSAVLAFCNMSEGLNKDLICEWTKTVHYQLSKKDETWARDSAQLVDEQISPLQLIIQGLELEEAQWHLKYNTDNLGLHSTPLQKSKIKECITTLCRRIDNWSQAQHFHLLAAQILCNRAVGAHNTASGIPLFLPSAALASNTPCDCSLLQIEWELRFRKALDALECLRKYLLSRTAIIKYKQDHTHGQHNGVRSSRAIASVESKIGACAAHYCIHCHVLTMLQQPLNLVGVDAVLQDLRDADIRGISVEELTDDKTISWIWKNAGIDPKNQDSINDGIYFIYLVPSDSTYRMVQVKGKGTATR
ncbi:hypothetical protein GYMLUDRAFT_55551 [Collybiopsis luxurians FD-317 M1]|nr:hypothetical protein GYMLUDRAFT_55551 [Collybiopsis luxurians FD-317 M1]